MPGHARARIGSLSCRIFEWLRGHLTGTRCWPVDDIRLPKWIGAFLLDAHSTHVHAELVCCRCRPGSDAMQADSTVACPSARSVGHCCSTCRASSTNEPACSATPR